MPFLIRDIEAREHGNLPPCPTEKFEQLNSENAERAQRTQINQERAERESRQTTMPPYGTTQSQGVPLSGKYLVVGIVVFVALFACALLAMLKIG